MRLKHFDLNLLVALDALLAERNTTRAGKRLHLSQSATSCALTRLREHFGDELLSRSGRNLVPTELGASLAAPVRDILVRAGLALDNRPGFDAASVHRNFTLMTSDYVSVVLMTDAIRHLEQVAPNITLEIKPNHLAPWKAVQAGEVDMLIAPKEFVPGSRAAETLFEDHYVCVAWAGNPHIGDSISVEQYLESGHVRARPSALLPGQATIDDGHFAHLGIERRVEITVGGYAQVPQCLTGSMRIATLHRRLAQRYARALSLKILPLPFKFPTIVETAVWSRQRDQDTGLRWLRTFLKQTVDAIAVDDAVGIEPVLN